MRSRCAKRWPVIAEPLGASGRVAVAFVALVALAAARAARAQESKPAGAPVYVEAGSCPAAPFEQVVPFLRIELGARLLSAPAAGALRVRIDCSQDQVLVSAIAADSAARIQRLDLAAAPSSLRPRIVALQVAEIVRERDPPSVPAAPRRAPIAGPAASAEPDPERLEPGVQLQLFAQASAFERDGRWLWGAGLRLEYSLFALRAGIDAVLATRNDASELGTDRVWSAYLAPHVAWLVRASRTTARVGVGHTIGVARVSGESTHPLGVAGNVTGAWAAPFALAGVGYAITAALRLDLRAEAGWVLLPVVGEVARARNVEIAGLWTNVQLGAALAF